MPSNVWPTPPRVWSFSALRDARECPRRWALTRLARHAGAAVHANGTSRTGGAGLGKLRGRVCHKALEVMLAAHADAGGPAWGTIELTRLWKARFPRGVIGLVRDLAREEVARADTVDALGRRRLESAVDEGLASMARTVTALLDLTFAPCEGTEGPTHVDPEVEVRTALVPGQHWEGTIDAVVRRGDHVTLVDYKTGAPSEADHEQLKLYACLYAAWPRAEGVVRRLAVLYADGSADRRDAPVGDALTAAAAAFSRDASTSEARIQADPPEASPNPDRCGRCGVRGRCDAYWQASAAWTSSLGAPQRRDFEGVVLEVLGAGEALRMRGGEGDVVVRTAGRDLPTGVRVVGTRIRVLGARSIERMAEHEDEPEVTSLEALSIEATES